MKVGLIMGISFLVGAILIGLFITWFSKSAIPDPRNKAAAVAK